MTRYHQGTSLLAMLRILPAELRAAQTGVADVARYAAGRFRNHRLARSSVEPDISASIDRMVIDAANGLIEPKKALAVLMADHRRATRSAAEETARCSEWSDRAEAARAAHDVALESDALAYAQTHERMAARLRGEADRLNGHIGHIQRELRQVQQAIEHAKLAKVSWHAERALADARATAAYAAARTRGVAILMDAAAAMMAAVDQVSNDSADAPSPQRSRTGTY